MQNSDIFSNDSAHIAHTYNRFPVAVESGHGAVATDFDGKNYIDFGSGIGTNFLGFCNEEWISAVTAELSPHLSQRDRKYSINILHRLPRDFGMFPPMTNRRLRMMLIIPYVRL